MSFKKVLSGNANSRTIFHENDEGMAIQKITDETALVDANKAIHNSRSSLDRWDDGKVVLRGVPQELIAEWKKKGWFTKEQFHRCLADERAQRYKVFGK